MAVLSCVSVSDSGAKDFDTIRFYFNFSGLRIAFGRTLLLLQFGSRQRVIEGCAGLGTRRKNSAPAFAWALSERRPASDERHAGGISGDIVGLAVADSI